MSDYRPNPAGLHSLSPELQTTCQLYTFLFILVMRAFLDSLSRQSSGSVLKKCCKYLTDYPVRGLSHTMAHSTWRYADDYTGIVFHYYEDEQKTKRADYTVTQLELDFLEQACEGHRLCSISDDQRCTLNEDWPHNLPRKGTEDSA